MLKKIKFYSYTASQSCKALARTVGGLRIKQRNSTYRARPDHLIINWGNSQIPDWSGRREAWLNHPEAVSIAANKLKTLHVLSESLQNAVPTFTQNRGEASCWILGGSTVYCRTLLQGHSGQGIVIATCEEELVNAPLYTLAFNAHHEYRVHIFQGRVIDVVKKSKRRDENPSRLIRNYSSGWVFIRNYETIIPSWVNNICVDAVRLLGLDFGAVDVGYNKEDDKCCIYEVNTAPGMEFNSQICKNYADAITAYCATMD